MKRNLATKLLAILLIAAQPLLLPACSDDNPDSGQDSVTTDTTAPETLAETTLEDLYPIPTAKYDGGSYDMLALRTGYWGQDYNDLYLAEDDLGDTVGTASYKRALKIESTYGLKFVQKDSADAAGELYTLHNAGDSTYKLVQAQAVLLMPLLASNGALHDTNKLPGLHLDAPWYNQGMNDSFSILGKFYMLSGDATATDKNGIFAMMFSKKMATDFSIPDIYQTVSDGTWTLDLMEQYDEMVTNDENGDGEMKKDDNRFGFIGEDFFGWMFMVSSGQTIAHKDADDIPYFTAGSEDAVNAVIKIQEIMYNSQFRSLDYLGETDYGIIPLPKYDENQPEYSSPFSPYASRYVGFPVVNQDTEFIGTVYDLLSRLGTDTVRTAYYDTLLGGKIARDEISAHMLDLIFDNMVHDIGASYNWGNCWFTNQQYFMARMENWASTWKSIESSAQKSLEDTIAPIQKADGVEAAAE